MNLFKPKNVAYAHCDLPCGVYDPAQARIEAESVLNAASWYTIYRHICCVWK